MRIGYYYTMVGFKYPYMLEGEADFNTNYIKLVSVFGDITYCQPWRFFNVFTEYNP